MKPSKKQAPSKKAAPPKIKPAVQDKKKQQAVAAAKEAIAAIDKLTLLTKDMKEFVICIDRNFDAPVCNCGAVMLVTQGDKTIPYAVVNLVDHGTFLTAEQLNGIRKALEKNNDRTASEIATISPTIAVAPLFNDLTLPMLTEGRQSSILMGMFLYSVYISNQFSPFAGKKIDIKNFASKCRCYFNNYPAGLGCGTTIQMVPLTATPHMVPKLVNLPALVGCEPGTKNVIIAMKNTQTGAVQKISAGPSMIGFYNEDLAEVSKQADDLLKLMIVFERLDKKIIELTAAKKAPAVKKPAKKR